MSRYVTAPYLHVYSTILVILYNRYCTVKCININKLLYAFKINTSLQSKGNTFGSIFWHLGIYYDKPKIRNNIISDLELFIIKEPLVKKIRPASYTRKPTVGLLSKRK